MSRQKLIRQGPLPDLSKILLPDKAPPIFQARVQSMVAQLIKVLTQVAPPRGDQPGWVSKYNAKLYPDMVLIRSPDGAGQPLALEHIEHLTTASDWEGFARKLATFLRTEHQDVMEQQTKSAEWQALNNFKTAATPELPPATPTTGVN